MVVGHVDACDADSEDVTRETDVCCVDGSWAESWANVYIGVATLELPDDRWYDEFGWCLLTWVLAGSE